MKVSLIQYANKIKSIPFNQNNKGFQEREILENFIRKIQIKSVEKILAK